MTRHTLPSAAAPSPELVAFMNPKPSFWRSFYREVLAPVGWVMLGCSYVLAGVWLGLWWAAS